MKGPIAFGPSPMTFSIVSAASDIARVALFGRLEVSMIGVFRRELSNLLRRRPGHVEVDMSRLRLIDSSGVELLLSFFRELRAQDTGITICGLRDQPLESFKAILLDDLWATSDPVN